MWTFSFHLACALHHLSSTSSAKAYTGFWNGYSIAVSFIISTISYSFKTQIQSSLASLRDISAFLKNLSNAKTVTLSILQASSLTHISWKLDYQRISMIVLYGESSVSSTQMLSLIVPSKSCWVSFPFVQKSFHWVAPFSAISSTS